MALSLRKSLQNFFVVTNGYSTSSFVEEESAFVRNWSLDLVHSLGQESFKELCAGYFEEKCYHAKPNTQHDKNFVDIWLFKESYSDAKPFGIIKCWETKAIPVKRDDLCEFKKIIAVNKVPLGVFITAGKFSKQAGYSIDKKLRLIDGQKLLNLIEALSEIRKQRLLEKITKSI